MVIPTGSELNDSGDIERLLIDIIDAFNSGDADHISACFAEDAELSIPHGPDPWGFQIVGRKAIRELYARRLEDIPDLRWQREEVFACGERGVMIITLNGRTRSGGTLNYRGCAVCTFRDGKILTMDSYWKGPVPYVVDDLKIGP